MTKEHEDKAQSTVDAEPKSLSGRHRQMMRRLIRGDKLEDICNDLGMSISRASIVKNSPLFMAEMEKMRTELDGMFVEAEAEKGALDPTREELIESAHLAARTLKGALSDENAGVRVNAAKDILDRTGYGKEDKLKARVVVEPSPSLVDVINRIVKERGGD